MKYRTACLECGEEYDPIMWAHLCPACQEENPDPREIARRIGVPIEQWPGNCYAIACKIENAHFAWASGYKAVYGVYSGPISKDSRFDGRQVTGTHHGWLVDASGRIIDPTRYVFEASHEPYIYFAEEDDCLEYDEGGNREREENMKPAPEWSDERPTDLEEHLSEAAWEKIKLLLGPNPKEHPVNWAQCFWLANLPPSVLGENARDVFLALKASGKNALIPIDNQKSVLGTGY